MSGNISTCLTNELYCYLMPRSQGTQSLQAKESHTKVVRTIYLHAYRVLHWEILNYGIKDFFQGLTIWFSWNLIKPGSTKDIKTITHTKRASASEEHQTLQKQHWKFKDKRNDFKILMKTYFQPNYQSSVGIKYRYFWKIRVPKIYLLSNFSQEMITYFSKTKD